MKKHLLFFGLLLSGIFSQAQTILNSSATITQNDINGYIWPVTIAGGSLSSPTVVTLAEDISLTNIGQYFIIGSEYAEFRGAGKTVTIYSATGYGGLVQNGTGSDAYSYVTISNVNVHSDNSIIADEAGWIGQVYFGAGGSNVVINKCSSDGDLLYDNGGIAGKYSECTVSNSHSSGAIGFESGGIFGTRSGGNAINCYSTGNMTAYSGGIYGYDSRGDATDCYSTGTIGDNCGGIMGFYCHGVTGNCYSNGQIGNSAGGIVSQYYTGSIVNCYSTGIITPGGNGIAPDLTGSMNSCYAANANWIDAVANANLLDVGIVWKEIATNVPYLLSSFDDAIYTPATANVSANASANFYAGNFLTGDYTILSISGNTAGRSAFTINSTTGLISVSNAVTGSYVIDVLFTDNSNSSYQISNFTVQVLSVLPVTWRSFTVAARNNTAYLQWSTSSEQNSRDFTIQHSTDGNHWNNIGTKAAAGNSSVVSNYDFIHVLPAGGNNYYRIQQTDLDGKYSYSIVRELKMNAANKSFTVLNTLVDNGVLQLDVKTSSILYLYGSDARLYWKKQLNIGVQNIDISDLPKGVYFLNGGDRVEKIIVQ